MVIPSKKDFLEIVKIGKPSPLYKEIEYLQPQSIYESLACPNSFLLESIKGPMKIARYSYIGFDPYLILKVKNGIVEIEYPSATSLFISTKPLNTLKELITAYKQAPFEYLPPFQGGAVGVLSYDFVHYFEKLPKIAIDDLNLPDAHFLMIDKLIGFDHQEMKSWIIVCPGARNTKKELIDWVEKYYEAEEEINKITSIVNSHKSLIKRNSQCIMTNNKIDIIYEMKKDGYVDIVKRAKEYIAAGDIFQANLSQRLSAHIGYINRWNIYRTLSSINPAPFAAYIDFGDYQIVSSSPERLLRVRNKIVETRPIAGTRPRGKDYREDELMRAELLLNEKERAEHIMLVDLERNDLGRVSDYGTVSVDEFMITENCSHVIHIVSNIKGMIANRKDCFDVIKAAFPGGTITGVPKIRCMEIIDELEPVRRGPYTGSVGYISFSGNMDFNIIIRTFVIKGEMAYVQVGAGIVADSDPEKEYYETLKKAEALIRTLERVGWL
ncbi:MAG: anthranilate synthase component I family protein [Nitrospirae bacterium]|nr:anthranilate synthase component I family protein [Nitrospirota bacterium]